jgi:hypothetical protein
VVVAAIPPDHRKAYQEFFSWLGGATEPMPPDVITRVRQMVTAPWLHQSAVQAVIEHVALRHALDPLATEFAYAELKALSWLPAEADRTRGYRPEALFTVFRKRLFASQAKFIDLPTSFQQKRQSADVLKWLGVRSEPDASQVVGHLLW